MDGIVIGVRRHGVKVQMNTNLTPIGDFNVVSQGNSSIIAVVTLRKVVKPTVCLMDWVSSPTAPVRIGDRIVSV